MGWELVPVNLLNKLQEDKAIRVSLSLIPVTEKSHKSRPIFLLFEIGSLSE